MEPRLTRVGNTRSCGKKRLPKQTSNPRFSPLSRCPRDLSVAISSPQSLLSLRVAHALVTTMEGWLKKKGENIGTLFWKDRWFKEEDGRLVYYTNQTLSEAKGHIDLKSIQDVRVRGFLQDRSRSLPQIELTSLLEFSSPVWTTLAFPRAAASRL